MKRAFCVAALFILLLQATNRLTPAYATQTRISVSPSSLVILPGSTMTVAVTVTDVTNLALWQVAIEYDASVITCSDAWIPADNVFQGKNPIEVVGTGPFNKSTIDGLACSLFGACITSGTVNVSFGTLFNLNFIGVGDGETTIRIGTLQNTIKPNLFQEWYSYLCEGYNTDFNEMPFIGDNGFAGVGNENVTVFPTSDLGLTFANVTASGYVTANKTSTVQAPPLANLTGQYLDIKVTASYIGNVTARLGFDGSNMTEIEKNRLEMMQYSPIPGDIQSPFGQVDMRDIGYIAYHFGTNNVTSGSVPWEPSCDITGPIYLVPDGKVDMRDISFVAYNFAGKAFWINITIYVDTVNNVIYGVTNHFSLIGIH